MRPWLNVQLAPRPLQSHGVHSPLPSAVPRAHGLALSSGSHTAHPGVYALDRQQWPPSQMALAHQSGAAQIAPALRLFFAGHLNSALRKWLAAQVLHFPLEPHVEHPKA